MIILSLLLALTVSSSVSAHNPDRAPVLPGTEECIEEDVLVHTSMAEGLEHDFNGLRATYRVTATNKLVLTRGSDVSERTQIWNVVRQVIQLPCGIRLTHLVFFDDLEAGTMYVASDLESDSPMWLLAINLARYQSGPGFTPRLVHELGHLLFANHLVEDEHGLCAEEPDPYWLRLHREFEQRFWEDCRRTEHLQSSHSEFWNHFHVDYPAEAMTVAEDVANNFAIFVLCSQPPKEWATIAWQKVHFFWEYPALVELRTQVRRRLPGTYLDTLLIAGADVCQPQESS